MRKLNFYWRTVLSISAAISLTLLLVGGGYFVINTYVQRLFAKQAFQRDYEEIIEVLKTTGISESFLRDERFIKYDISIIDAEGKIAFPQYFDSWIMASNSPALPIIDGTMSQTTESYDGTFENSENNVVVDAQSVLRIAYGPTSYNEFVFATPEDYERFMADFYRSTPFTIAGEDYTFMMYDMFALAPDDTGTRAIMTMLPYYLIGGALVAVVVSLLYAKYYTRKMLLISEQVTAMQEHAPFTTPDREVGDELVDLANNIYDMYDTMQDAMQKLAAEMLYTKKLEAEKQIFMRGATHELKTPIMTMSVMLEGMLADFGEYKDHERYLQKSLVTLQVMEKLVNEILSISKLEHIKFGGNTKIIPVIEQVLTMQEALIEEHALGITIDYMLETIELPMDSKSVSKLFSNIIGNAIQYSPEGGTLGIAITTQQITITNRIAKQINYPLEQLKEPFITSNQTEGHGLGLYIVDMLLNRHNIAYSYTIDKEQNKFTFTINL